MRFEKARTSRVGNRESNQDRALVIADDDAVLLAVADGMGGHDRGDLAAQAFVDTLRREFLERDPMEDPSAFLRGALKRAHRTIVAVGRAHQPPIRPLTTGVACLVQGDMAHWAHVGDSRFYLLREDHVFFQTRDHTPVADLVAAGVITERQARVHPMRNQVNQCLGDADHPPRISVGPTAFLQPGDVLLLCSDGLWANVTEARLLEILENDNLADAIETLAVTAEQKAWPQSDNITAVALRWEGLEGETATTEELDAADAAEPDPVARAIAELDQALAEYGHEMTERRGGKS